MPVVSLLTHGHGERNSAVPDRPLCRVVMPEWIVAVSTPEGGWGDTLFG
jgi:hypothetical protein